MPRTWCAHPALFVTLFSLGAAPTLFAQSAAIPTAPVREIHSDGLKSLPEPQLVSLCGLQTGSPAGRDDLQAAADKLVQSGLFAKVRYNFQTRTDGLLVTFHVEEAPRIPAYFDNLPWFANSELHDAIRQKLPFYDGTLPANGSVVEQAADALREYVTAHGLTAALEHSVLANPTGEGSIQDFHIDGASLHIAHLEFSDASLNSSRAVQQSLSDLLGKPYSRMAIDLFLFEQVRPIFQQKGFLRAKLGPPEVRLTGNPNQKLPEQIPVFIPIDPGAIYHWKSVDWAGNSVIQSQALTTALALKPGDVADGMAIEAAWDRVREEYGRRGYLEAKVQPAATYNDQDHTVTYKVDVEEGKAYHFSKLVITGLSLTAEKRLREAWPIAPGGILDKAKYEELLIKLQSHHEEIFGDLPLHYDEVGHWLQNDDEKGTVDVLLDFK
jgi:outer membrane protein insertion porin family